MAHQLWSHVCYVQVNGCKESLLFLRRTKEIQLFQNSKREQIQKQQQQKNWIVTFIKKMLPLVLLGA